MSVVVCTCLAAPDHSLNEGSFFGEHGGSIVSVAVGRQPEAEEIAAGEGFVAGRTVSL
jgi:hypothetical protein